MSLAPALAWHRGIGGERLREAVTGWLLVLPACVFLLAFTHLPAIATLIDSLYSTRVASRPLTAGLSVFASTDQGIDWLVICAATLMTSAPLLIAFLLFQRQFVQSFMRAGIR